VVQEKKTNVVIQFFLRLLQGMIIGVGGILPGVSGGAMCVIFGVYRPIMETLSHPFKNLRKYFWTLLPVGLGIAVGFVGLAGLVDRVMRAHEAPAVCVFIGLILGMLPQLYKDAGEQGRGAKAWISFGVSAVVLTTLFLYLKYGAGMHIVPNTGWWIFCGAVWGLNVIVPGMSSSSTMIFLGIYQPMLEGISHLRMEVVIPIGIGAAAVVLLLSRGVNALFRRYHTVTYHAILGAVIAMLIPIVPLHFASTLDLVLDVLCAVAGFFVSLAINHVSQKYLKKAGE
jgi:putative membrane protein